jgi:hypothetical protein
MLAIALPNNFAVRKGVEPLSSDRQSVMLAVTPTNLLYSRQDSNLQPLQSKWSIRPTGILLYFVTRTIPQFCGRTPVSSSIKLDILAVRRTGHTFHKKFKRSAPVASHRERSHSSSCIYYFIVLLLLKSIAIPL